MSDGGKGSSPRPYSVSQKEFTDNWERIFGRKEVSEKGDQRINNQGQLEEYREGYWHEIQIRG